MSDPMKQAWSDVGDGFSALGRTIKDRYRSGETDVEEVTSEAGSAFKDALDKVVAAARELGDRAGDVVRDDEVKAQAKRAASTLNDALNATVDLIGQEVGGIFKRGDKPVETSTTPEPEVPKAAPPSDDVRQ